MFALIAALCFAAAAACFEDWIHAHWTFWLLAGLAFWALHSAYPVVIRLPARRQRGTE
jgi:uncharacterized membrane protein YbaN (DUF454 family)